METNGRKVEYLLVDRREIEYFDCGCDCCHKIVLRALPGYQMTTVAELGAFWFFCGAEVLQSEGSGIRIMTPSSSKKDISPFLHTEGDDSNYGYPSFGRNGINFRPYSQMVNENYLMLVARDL
ncbi:MAG TPA: hypothetical protein VJB99_02090 [Patescibacteria group bacterium]|nr:hypothetical protein [Patescibacteria group bacterium]